jgi:multisubunit Na+/H+ antiporter MnhG subunit
VALDKGRAKLLLAVALILVTAPVAAHLVARASYRGSGEPVHVDADGELTAAIDQRCDEPR